MSVQNQTKHRLFLRGDTAKFVIHFFADAAQTVPLIPKDTALYPSYTIYDINNEVIQSGVGIPEVSPGRYRAEYQVPFDAPLSGDLARWRIEWVILSTDDRQVDYVEEFDVKDTVITASETREQKFISLIGTTYRAILRLPQNAYEVALDTYVTTSMDRKVVDNVSSLSNDIRYAPDGDSIVYYYDIDAALLGNQCGTFSIIWKVRNTAIEPQNFVFQILEVVTPYCLSLVTSLRMLIDKLQKRLGTVQAYEDSDIVEYLTRGAELVNSGYPTTYFGYATMPQMLTVHHLLFSGWYALQAQGLLSTEVSFSFSGQSVTLDYDQAGGLADVAGRWLDFLNSTLSATKMSILRRASPVGTVAGRKYRYNDLNMYTYKIASVSGATNRILGQMTTLGLLF
jgi:hypothetical protein